MSTLTAEVDQATALISEKEARCAELDVEAAGLRASLQALTTELDATKAVRPFLLSPLPSLPPVANKIFVLHNQKFQATPKTEVTEKKELRKLREEHSLIQMRLQNEDLAKRTLESNLQDLVATNHRLMIELEGHKKLLEQTRDASKSLTVDTKMKEPSEESIHSIYSNSSGSTTNVFGTLRRGLSKRRSKAEAMFSLSEKDLQISSQVLEGQIKVPKEGRIRNGWTKRWGQSSIFFLFKTKI